MPRHFDDQIQDLLEKLVRMGRTAESMIQMALRTLIERDESLAAEVSRREEEVNELQMEIDDRAVKLTALQQPVGSDVRFLFMASRIATELERIGDQAVNIMRKCPSRAEGTPVEAARRPAAHGRDRGTHGAQQHRGAGDERLRSGEPGPER